MKRPASHTFRGKRWRIIHRKPRDCQGKCQAPWTKRKAIYLAPTPCPPDKRVILGAGELWLAIHEGLHACLWDTGEEAVEETSVDLANFLYRLGYRLPEDEE